MSQNMAVPPIAYGGSNLADSKYAELLDFGPIRGACLLEH